LSENRFMPAGRIWYGAGRPKAALFNCFVIPTEDSREGWGDTVKNMIIISGMGGGIGINFSPIRPRGTSIHGVGGTATGAVSLMEIINSAGNVLKAGGGRRVALMFELSLDHPDIEEFLDKKLKMDQLNNANVSVVIPHLKQDEFIEAVRENKKWALIWQGKVVKEVSAKKLWDRLIDNMLKSAEPGILNGHLANEMNNIYYEKEVISVNPCGEVWLEANGACDLGSLVLPRFVNSNGKLDKNALAETITIAVRFLDNVLDISTYPNADIKNNCQHVRRIGLGIMGLHDMLIKMGMKYNSEEALDFISKLMKFIRNRAYESSCFLAVERGSFPLYNSDLFLKSGFCKTLSEGIRAKIKEYGIRNCALLSIAPTGTISIIAGVSSGVEPIYALAYKRRYMDGDDTVEEIWTHPLYEEYVKKELDVSNFQTSHDLSVKNHLDVQIICQRYIDNAVSKTINIPQKYNKKEISSLILNSLHEIKGITLYVDGSRGESPMEAVSEEELLKSVCPKGVCEV